MNKNQDVISASWLCVILVLLCLFGVLSLMSTLEMNKLKREQIRIYNRINNLEQSLRTKDKELERYLIKEKMKLYGYTVEKEKLYVLELPRQYNPYVSQVNDFNIITRFAPLFYEAKRLSEKEIKAIDERYRAFAVKVEE